MAVYLIETPNGDHVVEASTKNAAINYVARKDIKATTLKTSDLVKYVRQGVEIETITSKEETPEEVFGESKAA